MTLTGAYVCKFSKKNIAYCLTCALGKRSKEREGYSKIIPVKCVQYYMVEFTCLILAK